MLFNIAYTMNKWQCNGPVESIFNDGGGRCRRKQFILNILHICRNTRSIVPNRCIDHIFTLSRTPSCENNVSSSFLYWIISYFKVGKSADFQSATILRLVVYFWVLQLPVTWSSSLASVSIYGALTLHFLTNLDIVLQRTCEFCVFSAKMAIKSRKQFRNGT